MSGNLVFDLLCEWNRWKGQRGKVLILILGFSLISFVFSIVLRVGDILFFENPTWVGSSSNYYTISSSYNDGRQAGVSRQTISSLKKFPYVKDVSWISVRPFDFRSPNHSIYQPLSIAFDPDLIRLLKLRFPDTDQLTSGVWITKRYWREAFDRDPNIVGQYLTHPNIPSSIPIRGILPEQFNTIGPWSPDIFVPRNYLRYVTPFSQDSSVMIDRFLRSVPEYYGFFNTHREINVNRLTEEMRNNDFSVRGIQIDGHGGQLKVFKGIVLDQQSKTILKQLWTFSVFLVIALVTIFSLNAFMSFSNRNLLLAEEYRLLQTIGAEPFDLIRPVILVSAIKILVIAVISQGINLIAGEMMNGTFDFPQLQTFSRGWDYQKYWLLSLAFISLIYSSSIFFPLLNLRKKYLFSRMMGTNRDYKQLIFGQGSLIFQLSIAIVAVILTIQLAKQQLSMFKPFNFDTSIQQIVVKHHGGRLPVESIESSHKSRGEPRVAISISQFEKPQSISIGEKEFGFEREFEVHYVSRNYFEELGADITLNAQEWNAGLVINRSAQKFFSSNGLQARGASLNLGDILGTHSVAGVVEDIHHQGRFKKVAPTVYLPFDAILSPPKTYNLYVDLRENQESKEALQRYLDKYLVDAQITLSSTLETIVRKQELRAQQLFYFSISVVAITLIGIVFTLSYQVRARLQLEQSDYGLLMAIGVPFSSLLFRACKPIVIAFIFSVALTAVLYYFLSESNHLRDLVIFNYTNILAIIIVGIVSIGSALFPIVQLWRSPIIDLIKQE